MNNLNLKNYSICKTFQLSENISIYLAKEHESGDFYSIKLYKFSKIFPNILLLNTQKTYQNLHNNLHKPGVLKNYNIFLDHLSYSKDYLYILQDYITHSLTDDMNRRIQYKATYTNWEKIAIIENLISGLTLLQDLAIPIKELAFHQLYFTSTNQLKIDILDIFITSSNNTDYENEKTLNLLDWLVVTIIRISEMIVDIEEINELIRSPTIQLKAIQKILNDANSPREIKNLIQNLQKSSLLYPLALGFIHTSSGFKLVGKELIYQLDKKSSNQSNQAAYDVDIVNLPKAIIKQIKSNINKKNHLHIREMDIENKFDQQILQEIKHISFDKIFHTSNIINTLTKLAQNNSLKILEIQNTILSTKFIKNLISLRGLISLEMLNLSSTRINDPELLLLSTCEYFIKLKQLSLNMCQITDIGLYYLASSPFLAVSLISLEIRHQIESNLTCKGLEYLANSKYLNKLNKLDISGNSIKDVGIEILCRSKNFESLEILNVSYNSLTKESLVMFSKPNSLKALKFLSIKDVIHNLKSIDLFFNSNENSKLIGLEINGNPEKNMNIYNLRMSIIVHSKIWKMLRYVDIGNWIVNKTSFEIMNTLVNKNLTMESLNLYIRFDQIILDSFKNLMIFANLRRLGLANCELGMNWFFGLKCCYNLPKLEILDLSMSKIDHNHIKVLMQSELIKPVKILILAHNKIKDIGLIYIIRKLRRIIKIDVTMNKLTAVSINVILKLKKDRGLNLKKITCSQEEVGKYLKDVIKNKLYEKDLTIKLKM